MSRYRYTDDDGAREARRVPGHALADLVRSPARRGVVRTAGSLAALLALIGRGAASAIPRASRPAAAAAAAAAGATAARAAGAPLLGFAGVPASTDDTLVVPRGYRWSVLVAWGDPVGIARPDGYMPQFAPDASNGAEDQELQAGMHHDGMHYFPIDVAGAATSAPTSERSSRHGLLAINHEYFDFGYLIPQDANWSALQRVRKAQAAVGVSIVEVALLGGRWQVIRPSRHARRIHANTPMLFYGPAAGHPAMRTARDPDGRTGLGTVGNCAYGATPWGTYLSCEEGCYAFFQARSRATDDEKRMGYGRFDYARWGAADPRFGSQREPNETNHFDWVVEIDPFEPGAPPVKRTALGRMHHECATCAVCQDGRIAVYLSDDDRNEYLYKFVSARPWNPRDRAANRDLLDEGTLYVARFDADGSGRWLELAPGRNGLTARKGFATPADVCLRTRAAADIAGATPLDRPEWVAVDPTRAGRLMASLTNNHARRHDPRTPGANAVNPRAPNPHGHLLRWTEAGGDHAATRFEWQVFVLAGDPEDPDPVRHGSQRGDAFSSPDGLLIDARGVVWVQTDATGALDAKVYGNNAMLALDPRTREARRFLTGPRGCEISGAVLTPDGRTMFVNVMHPGEATRSNWPAGTAGARPRSATVAIRKDDGGVIGT